jgi:hypothetical protein
MEVAMNRASLLDVVKTVLWGFLGIRRRASHERVKIEPLQVIVVAVVFVVLFVLTLLAIVRMVVG